MGSALADPQKTHDWIRDKELVAAFANALKAGNQYTRAEMRKISDTAEKLLETTASGVFTEERKKRVQALMKDFGVWSELSDALLEEALADEATKVALATVAVEHHLEEIKDKLVEHEGIRRHIEELRREEAGLQYRVDTLQHKEEELRNHVPVSETVEELDASIQERKAELEEYDRKLRDARIQYHYELNQKDKLDESLNSMLCQYRDKAGQITRLFDASILNTLLHEQRVTSVSPSAERLQFNPALLHAPMSRDEIIDRVYDFLHEKAGRGISRNDTINYLLCISQGFITTFTGKPGVGKTTLCGLLAKSLGLSTGDDQNRYIEIPIESGWTSPQDFIGSYNSVTQSADIRNVEAWEALERLNEECEKSSEVSTGYAPFIFLLDEVNLSPVERYWSAFLRNGDLDSYANRSVFIGGGRNWKLPEHLRFLATVNFDPSREKLSPRFLDRSWVITLDASGITEQVNDNPENYVDMVPYYSLHKAFCSGMPDHDMDGALMDKWNAIRNIFQSRNLPLVPRNQKMVRNYCTIACACMERATTETQFAPLDYAFAQKILPSVNGSGESYRELIYDLRRE